DDATAKDHQKFSGDDQDKADSDSERTISDNKGDEFVHPKFTTHDDEEDKDKDSFDPRVHTPSQSEPSNDDEANADVAQSGFAEE
ncbi:hypothetical protein Tco_0504224, partial [Tanacetum coccineum]